MEIETNTLEAIETVDPAKSEERFSSIRESLLNRDLIALNIEICSACNLACHYCAMHARHATPDDSGGDTRKDRYGIMGLARFREIIDKCDTLRQVQVLYLHGMGEPLLNPEIGEIVAYAKAAGIFRSIVLITNGVLLSSNLLALLSAAGLDEIRISYDIFTPEKYFKLKGKDFSTTVRNNIEECLAYLRDANDPVRFTIECKSWMEGNGELAAETDAILQHFFTSVAAVPTARFRLAQEFDWNGQAGHTENHFRRDTPCEQPFYMLLVHCNGQASPCCIDTHQAIALGNVHEISHLGDIVSGPRLRVMRTKLLQQDYTDLELCRTCNVRSAVDPLLQERSGELLGLL